MTPTRPRSPLPRRLAAVPVALVAAWSVGDAAAQGFPPPIVRTQVAPLELTDAEGPAQTLGPFVGQPTTWMLRYDASYFNEITAPAPITGLSFRLDGSATAAWPAAAVTISDLELSLGAPSAAADAKGEFLNDRDNDFDNGDLFTPRPFSEQVTDLQVVRDGTLAFAAGDFPAPAVPGEPAPLGVLIEFDTPYAYLPGEDLIVYIRSTGQTAQPVPLLDATLYGNGQVDAIVANSATATLDTVGSFAFETPVASFRFEVPVVTGDLTADGSVDIQDLRVIEQNLGIGTTPAQGDLDLNGVVNIDDVALFIEDVVGTVFGDVNLDRAVDTADLAVLAGAFGVVSLGYDYADFTLDGVVDTADLAILAGAFGFNGNTAAATAPTAVPEPGVAVLVAGLLAGCLRRAHGGVIDPQPRPQTPRHRGLGVAVDRLYTVRLGPSRGRVRHAPFV